MTFYIGPTIPKLGLRHNDPFVGGLPPKIEAAFQKVPALFELFIDSSELSNAQANLLNPKSTESLLSNQVASQIAKI